MNKTVIYQAWEEGLKIDLISEHFYTIWHNEDAALILIVIKRKGIILYRASIRNRKEKIKISSTKTNRSEGAIRHAVYLYNKEAHNQLDEQNIFNEIDILEVLT